MYKAVEGTEHDIGPWMELVRSVRANFPGLETEDALRQHRDTVLKFMKQHRAVCVRDGDRVAGVLLFSVRYNMICCLAVSGEFRRRGIGSSLLAYALEKLDRTKPISVTTFREGDEKGTAPRALYRKFSFVPDELVEEFGYPNQKFVLYPNCRTADVYGNNYAGVTRHCREASRAIILRGGSILLSHETVPGLWMLPGGGLEAEETPAECCVRESAEETGLRVHPESCFLVLNEYYEDWKYVSYFFHCTVTGTAERSPTERELQAGAVPEWVDFSTARDIFSRHREYAASDEERRGIYLREYTALSALPEEITGQ